MEQILIKNCVNHFAVASFVPHWFFLSLGRDHEYQDEDISGSMEQSVVTVLILCSYQIRTISAYLGFLQPTDVDSALNQSNGRRAAS